MHTRGDLGILIPEFFPENAANLIPTSRDGPGLAWRRLQPRPREYLNHTFSSALTWQHGTHTLKTGGLFALEHMNSNLVRGNDAGVVRVSARRRIHGVSELSPRQLGRRMRRELRLFRNGYRRHQPLPVSAATRLYVQDTWRIHPTVTLDLGLRYAFYPPLTDDRDMLFTFSPDAYDPAQAPTVRRPRWRLCGPGDRESVQRDSRGRQETRRTGAPFMRPTGTTCSPVSAPHGIRAERADWSCAPATACTSTRRRSGCSLRMCMESSRFTTRFARTSSSATPRSRIPARQAASVVKAASVSPGVDLVDTHA